MIKFEMERTDLGLVIDGVREEEQTLSPVKPFWVFFATNLSIAGWLMGVLIASMGVKFSDAMIVMAAGSAVGGILPACLAILGPVTRLSQMEAGRFSLGRIGKRAPAFLNWVNCIGWDAIANNISASALVALVTTLGGHFPFWAACGVLVLLQMVIGIYGHHVIQMTSRYMALFLVSFSSSLDWSQ